MCVYECVREGGRVCVCRWGGGVCERERERDWKNKRINQSKIGSKIGIICTTLRARIRPWRHLALS